MRTILCLALLVLLGGSLLLLPFSRSTSAQTDAQGKDQPQISESAALQIQSLMNAKKALTAEQKKIDSQLLFAAKQKRGDALAPNLQTMRVEVEADAKGNVLVDIKAINLTAELLQSIAQVGGEVIYKSERYNAIRASIPLDSLEALARSQDVKSIRRAAKAFTRQSVAPQTGAPKESGKSGDGAATPYTPYPSQQSKRQSSLAERAARVQAQLSQALPGADGVAGVAGPAVTHSQTPFTRVGSVTSQGDRAHRAQEARNLFRVTGAGVKIGVLSDSVRFLEQAQASGDLPPDVTVIPGESGIDPTPPFEDIGEGTAMLEIIHDLAPDAKLFFATAFTSPESFADNIRRLRFEYGCDIIVDDVGYIGQEIGLPFQDDLISQAVNEVGLDGAFYFSAAGNDGNFNDGTSGTWEGDYVPSRNLPPLTAASYTDVLDFGGGNISNRLETFAPVVFLHWADTQGASANDYDLYVLNSTLTQVVAFSIDSQDGDDFPFEGVGIDTPTFLSPGQRVVVARFGNAEPRALHLQSFGELGISTPGNTFGHPATDEAIAVAAVNVAVAGAGPFTGGPTNPVELFSSDGPRRLFYNPDGTEITPGNLLFRTGGGYTRPKVDIAAADGVTTTNPFLRTFFGTSAAAPHAAAVAGLVKSAAPRLSKAEIRTALTSSALDIEARGFDRDSGFGIVTAVGALRFIGAQGFPFLELGTITTTPADGDGDPFIEPSESGRITVQLRNTGVATATNTIATLTTSTPGVTITQGTSNYSDIPPAGSAANTTPFTFSLAEDAPCGLTVRFTLTVNYDSVSGDADGDSQSFNFDVQTGTELFTNGGFETGTLAGWTTAVIPGSSGNFFVASSTTLPQSGLPTVGPRSGSFYAVNDQTGPGTHVLLQTFTVPAGSPSVVLSFDMFANNWASTTVINPIGLDHRVGANQHARVDILSAGAPPFTTGTGVLRNLYLGADAGTNPRPYTHYEFDITEQVSAGGTFQLRFAVTNNQLFFNLGVDNVSISAGCDVSALPDSRLTGD